LNLISYLGLVLNNDLSWITYRGTFDLGYILKIAEGEKLPPTEAGFYEKLAMYFPHFYDIKCMLKDISSLPPGTLNSIASFLNVPRLGTQHQAGSDSLVTSKIFFKLQDEFLNHYIAPEYHNVLHGLSGGDPYAAEYEANLLSSMSPPLYYDEGYDMPAPMMGYPHPYYHEQPHVQYSGEYYANGEVIDYM